MKTATNDPADQNVGHDPMLEQCLATLRAIADYWPPPSGKHWNAEDDLDREDPSYLRIAAFSKRQARNALDAVADAEDATRRGN